MVGVVFRLPGGTERCLDGEAGASVMSVASRGGLRGIVAECNGSAACATCHVYVDAAWLAAAGAIGGHEDDMLDFTAAARRPESRLSCQIVLSDALNGLVVTIPDVQ